MTDFESRPGMEARHTDGDATDARDAIRADFANLAIVFDDVGDLPASAQARLKPGIFDDPKSFHEWLEDGLLVSYDENGDTVPIGWVYVVETYNEELDQYEYEVYVDTDTNP